MTISPRRPSTVAVARSAWGTPAAQRLTTREVIEGKVTPPKAAAELQKLLGSYSK